MSDLDTDALRELARNDPYSYRGWIEDVQESLREAADTIDTPRTPRVLPTREQIESAVGYVLFNASNYPKPVASRILGQDTSRLTRKVVDAVLARIDKENTMPDEVEDWRARALEAERQRDNMKETFAAFALSSTTTSGLPETPPKPPAPRLVVIDRNRIEHAETIDEIVDIIEAQPDVLTVIDNWTGTLSDGSKVIMDVAGLKEAILRDALWVES